MSKHIPTIKLIGAAVVAGLVMVARTENLDWRSALVAFLVGAAPALGVGWSIPDLNPAPSTVTRVLERHRVEPPRG